MSLCLCTTLYIIAVSTPLKKFKPDPFSNDMGDHEAGGLVSSSSTASIVRDLHLAPSTKQQSLQLLQRSEGSLLYTTVTMTLISPIERAHKHKSPATQTRDQQRWLVFQERRRNPPLASNSLHVSSQRRSGSELGQFSSPLPAATSTPSLASPVRNGASSSSLSVSAPTWTRPVSDQQHQQPLLVSFAPKQTALPSLRSRDSDIVVTSVSPVLVPVPAKRQQDLPRTETMEIDSVTRPSYAAVTTAPSSDSTTVPTQVNRVVSSVSSRAKHVASAVVTPPATASLTSSINSPANLSPRQVQDIVAALNKTAVLLARELKKRL